MSISKSLAFKTDNKLIIPFTGKMFRSNIAKDNKALCFLINRGYIETEDLDSMLEIIDTIAEIDAITLVGKIEKIKNMGNITYRQRIFFKSLNKLLNFCKTVGLRFELAKDFRATINSIMNCRDELIYLERYALRFNETIDEWLTNCCIINLNYLLLSMGMYSSLAKRTNEILRGKKGYLDRSPYLVSSYDISTHSSGVFLQFCSLDDTRLFTPKDVKGDTLFMSYGYTTKNIESDRKAGVFK